MDVEMQQTGMPRRRRRPALSCLACRRKKVSCDRAQPCRRCIAAGNPCTYRIEAGAFRRLSEVQQSNHAIAKHSSTENIDGKALLPDQPSPRDVLHNFERVEATSAISQEALEQSIQQLSARVQELEQYLHRSCSNHVEAQSSESTLRGLQTTLNKTKFSRLSHFVATPPEFSNIINFFKRTALFKQLVEDNDRTSQNDPAIQTLIEESVAFLDKCKFLARGMKVRRPSRLQSPLWLNVQPPPRELADTCIRAYFKNFESAYRILHLPTLAIDCVEYWSDPDNASIMLRLEVALVSAIGSSVIDPGERANELGNKAHEVVQAAQMWLAGPLEKHRLTLKAIQIHCLTILARQIFGIGGDLVWISIGQLVHEAMQMGLHRDPKYLHGINLFESELRRRLWATILEMSVQSSFDSEMPPRISLEEFDTEPPANIDDNGIDMSSAELRAQPRDVHTMMSAQLLLLDSLPTRLRALQLLNSISKYMSYAECLELSSSISKACGSLALLDQTHNEDGTPFQRNLADYLTRRFQLYLHAPFSCRAGSNPLFAHSRKICVETAMTLIPPSQDSVFAHLMVSSGGIFKSGIRYAGVAIAVELISQCRVQSADLTLTRNTEYINMLKSAVRKLISLSEERIKHGESNVKNHTFLSMVLAEAESIEQGLPTELTIAESARHSLAFCHELLTAQSGSETSLQPTDPDVVGFEGDIAEFDFDFDVDDFLQGSMFA